MDYFPPKSPPSESAECSNLIETFRFNRAVKPQFFFCAAACFKHIYNIDLRWSFFTGEQVGQYGEVNGALGNGYKGVNKGM